MRSPADLTERFRAEGRKLTPQRQLVFQILYENPEHPSAEAVFEAARAEMPTLSLRTVYQTLNDLVAMGEIGRLDAGTGSVRFDPNTGEHHHLVCRRCGKVRDLHLEIDAPLPPPATGFWVEEMEVTYRGVCADCRRRP